MQDKETAILQEKVEALEKDLREVKKLISNIQDSVIQNSQCILKVLQENQDDKD